MLRSVFADRGLPVTPEIRDLAAQLALPDSVLAGPSAARWHGITVASSGTFVALDSPGTRLPRVHLLREPVPADDVCRVQEARATTVERTVFDCARLLPEATAAALLEQALVFGWTSVPQLVERIRDATGRHGTPRMIKLVRGAALGSRSASDELAIRLLQRAGIWGWHPREPISDRWGLICIGDLVFPGSKLLVELAKDAFEDEGQQRPTDRERHRRLLAAGWTVLRYSWVDLTTRPTEVVDELRSRLDQVTPSRW